MAFSIRWRLLAATAAAVTLAFAACGDDEKKKEDNTPRNDAGGDLGGLFEDGGILDVTADLDDNVAGSACTTSADCGGKNAVCAITTAETGSCSGVCNTNSNCGAGGECITV